MKPTLRACQSARWPRPSPGRRDGPVDRLRSGQEWHGRRLVGELRHAITSGELRLVYQPKIDASTMNCCAVEALLRWRHPRRGPVPPGEFVAAAERFGLMPALGDWVVASALAQMARWREAGLVLQVAINVSAAQLRWPGFASHLERQLSDHRIPPTQLVCEITESLAVADSRVALEALGRLRDIGVGLSIDDFGVGHSSLSSLCRLPVKELKLDRSFAVEMARSARGRQAVTVAVVMAHTLGLTVVAEGLESAHQCRLARDAGCDALQGYHLAEPLEAGAIARWVLDQRHQAELSPCAA